MIITQKTKLKLLNSLTESDIIKIKEQIPYIPLRKEFEQWNCGDFIRILNNDDKFISKKIIGKTRFLIEYLGRLKTFEQTMKNIFDYLKKNETNSSEEERMATNGITFPTFQEQIFLKVQERFCLKSFDDVESVPLTHYMLIVRDESSKLKFEKNLQKIYQRKNKLNGK